MALEDFADNLRLLCGYGKSITNICENAGINRQQFNKYLSGASQPSLQTLRKICDYFGIEDYEIFMDKKAFASVVRINPPKLGEKTDVLYDYIDKLARVAPEEQPDMDKYLGFYHTYFKPDNQTNGVFCNLHAIFKREGAYFTKQIERHLKNEFMLPSVIKYEGVIMKCGDRLICYENETNRGQSAWNTILYASGYDVPTTLTGLTTGIMPESAHSIQCYRIVFQYIGTSPDIRKALRRCGVYDQDDPTITDYIRHCVDNTHHKNEINFSPRF